MRVRSLPDTKEQPQAPGVPMDGVVRRPAEGRARTGAEQCGSSPWAAGPVCNIIDQVIELPRPVPSKGRLGVWRLSADVQTAIRQQLRHSRTLGTGSAWLQRDSLEKESLELGCA